MLDQKDHLLLKLLQDNSRISASEAGKELGLSVPAASERIKKLLDGGYIKKFTVQLDSKKLGKIYSCRLFYGNGTARLVRNSWRDKKSGVILDIGSHLLDTCLFWFGKKTGNFKLRTFHKFENKHSQQRNK